MMKMAEVFVVLAGERDYQNALNDDPSRPDVHDGLSMGDHLLAMQELLNKAQQAWYSGSSPFPETTEQLRKMLAVGVASLEKFGVEPRKR